MQRAEQPDGGRGGLSPLNAFLVALGVLAAIAAVVLLTRLDPAPLPDSSRNEPPDFSLTDAEAIERFEELHQLVISAYERRDPSLIPQIYVDGSSAAKRVANEIETLLREGVLSRTRFKTIELGVASNESTEVVVRQVVEIHPHFISEDGDELAGEKGPQRQVTLWTLQVEGSEWLIARALVVQSRPL